MLAASSGSGVSSFSFGVRVERDSRDSKSRHASTSMACWSRRDAGLASAMNASTVKADDRIATGRVAVRMMWSNGGTRVDAEQIQVLVSTSTRHQQKAFLP